MSNEHDLPLPGGSGAPDTPEGESKAREPETEATLRKQLSDLQEQFNQLREERDQIARDRDAYLKSLKAALATQAPLMTPEELDDLKRNGISQEELVAEIDRLFPPKSSGG